MSSISASEVLSSFAVELIIFGVTLIVAVVFKLTGVMNMQSSKTAQGSKSSPMNHGKLRSTESTMDSEKIVARQAQAPRAQKHKHVPIMREVTRIVDTMVECGNRRQASDALAMYEELRGIGQLRAIKEHGSRSKQSAADVYSVLVQCAGHVSRPDLIDVLISDMRRVGIERPLPFYESTMKLLASKKYFHEALAVYGQLEVDGLEPSPVTLSCLVNFAAEVGELDKALGFFRRLSQVGTPSIRACMMALRVHAKRQDWPKSLEVIREMQARGSAIDSLVLNVALATGVAAGDLPGARALLDEFSKSTPSIADVVSYNTLMKGYAQHREADHAMSLLDQMTKSGVRANAITFNTVMDAAVRSSRPTDAWQVLVKMQHAGIAADKFTCTTLMKGLQEGAKSEQLSVILDLLKCISSDCDHALSSSLFRSIIEAAARLDDLELTARAIKQMREQRVVISAAEYQRFIQMLDHNGASLRCATICREVPIEGSQRSVSVC